MFYFILYYILENFRRPATLGYLSGSIKGSILATGLSGESQLKSLFVAVLAPAAGILADKAGIGGALVIIALIQLAGLKLAYIRKD